MSARDQAREAVKAAACQANDMISAVKAAEAASDVWEPIVRDLVGVIDEMLETGGYLTQHMEIVAKAREALQQ